MKCFFVKFIDNIDIGEFSKSSERLFQIVLCELFALAILQLNFFSLRKNSMISALQKNSE
ncbi:hypothetical protein HYN56_05000 [Flavobacterium crocinum]|uniref:Uncharacterized protein n=1 Tax=Flavobacterium crocinum TaxID=2183896 RepID=A0A2S1YHU5_9FLAO|nr:hypothetical protein HYN56_05000 [Flavobacterium crocinum]